VVAIFQGVVQPSHQTFLEVDRDDLQAPSGHFFLTRPEVTIFKASSDHCAPR
jgi:hypothetical protein